jgi:Flp pilus assembly protein TadB
MSAVFASLAIGTAILLTGSWRSGPARLRSLSDPDHVTLLDHIRLDNPNDQPAYGSRGRGSLGEADVRRRLDGPDAPSPMDGGFDLRRKASVGPRRDRMGSASSRRRTTARFTAAERRRHRWASWIVASAFFLLFGVPVGLALGAAALVVVRVVLGRMEPASVRRRRQRISADLPLAVDLLAACLRAGRPPDEALVVVAPAVAGPLGELLDQVEHRLRLGADPIDAWRQLADEPACASLARAVQRALTSGAALAQTLEHVAADARQERRWTADEQARAVETRAVVPLGLCFLPAFVLIGIVPTIAGSLSSILTLLDG